MIVIGLVGKRGHGKSTFAARLVEKFGFAEFSFADPLKQACRAIFGFTSEQLNDLALKEQVDDYWKVTPRTCLQLVGTDLFRDRLPECEPRLHHIWIRAMERRLQIAEKQGVKRIVVSDVRFPDEWKMLQSIGAIFIRIVRPLYGMSGANASHISETALDDDQSFAANVVCHNRTETLDDYQRVVDSIAATMIAAEKTMAV